MVKEPSPRGTSIRVGALTIGQSPRPDLVAPLRERMPGVEIVEAGALDGLSTDALPDGGVARYPLRTRLRAGPTVTVDATFVARRLQTALERLEADAGVAASCVLCAGRFDGLSGRKAVLKPFALASAVLHALGLHRIGVVCPFEDQRAVSTEKWGEAGFDATVWVQSPAEPPGAWLRDVLAFTSEVEILVLDYVGHRRGVGRALRRVFGYPVLDMGGLTAAVAGSVVRAPEPSGRAVPARKGAGTEFGEPGR